MMLALLAMLPLAQCQVSTAPVIARATLADGREARITPGALHIGKESFSRCDTLPGGHPLSLAVRGNEVFVGFRDVGVRRYDGTGFAALPALPNTPIRALAVNEEWLWIGTASEGLWQQRGEEEPVRHPHRVLGKRGITALTYRHETLHVGSDPQGHWKIQGERVLRLSKDPVGCFAPKKQVQALPPGAQCPSAAPALHVTAMAEHEGTLYVGSFDKGLVRKRAGKFVPVAGSPRFINALLPVGSDLYLGTAEGLFRMRAKKISKVVLGTPSEHVNALAKGNDGTLWVATSCGVAGLLQGKVQLLGVAQGLPARIVYSVAVTSDNALWVGTAAGALRIQGELQTLYSQAQGRLPHDWVTGLRAQGNEVYAGTYDAGVVRLAADGGSKRLSGLGHTWVNPGGVSFLGKTLAVATLGDGLWFHDGKKATLGPRLPSDDVTAILHHEGRTWVGTRAGLASIVLRSP